jgi:hypothetical protein
MTSPSIDEALRLIGNLAHRSRNDTDMEAFKTLKSAILVQP